MTPPLSRSRLQSLIHADCFKKDNRLALLAVLRSLGVGVLGIGLLMSGYWPLIPLGWILMGFAIMGFWTLAHDCTHDSLFTTRRLNHVAGHLLALPTLYPFTSLKQSHLFHHKNLNHIDNDSVWRPEVYSMFQARSALYRYVYLGARGYGWWLGAIFHIFPAHYQLTQKDRPHQNLRVRRFSLVISYLSLFGLATWLVTAPLSFASFFVAPWLVFSTLLATVSLFQHTSPLEDDSDSIRWRADKTPLDSISSQTIDLQLPRIVELLIHHVNIHTIHHYLPAIPCYRLAAANQNVIDGLGTCPWNRVALTRYSLLKIINRYHFFDSTTERLVSLSEARLRFEGSSTPPQIRTVTTTG